MCQTFFSSNFFYLTPITDYTISYFHSRFTKSVIERNKSIRNPECESFTVDKGTSKSTA